MMNVKYFTDFRAESTRFSVCFRGISRLCYAFIFSRWFKLAHIYIQVRALHNGGKSW